jgi:hypothetical protein
MKLISVLGILLVVLGGFTLAYHGVSYTRRERVLDVGPIHATRDAQEHLSLPPVLGCLSLLAGFGLIFAGGKPTI